MEQVVETPYKSKQTTATEQLKIPPHSIEAEQSLLGGLMLDNHSWDKVVSKVVEEDFYRFEHRLIFRVISNLVKHNKPFDVITVTEALKAIEKLDSAGTELYLFELANNTPSVANIAAYADIVRERSVLRQLIGVANEIADTAYHTKGQQIAEILDQAETKIFSIAEQTARDKGPEKVESILTRTINKIELLYHSKSTLTGLSTGFKALDDKTSGLQAADLVIVAGRPSMGKTTLAMNLAENAAITSDKPILIFTMEMPSDAIAMRMISSLGRINLKKIRSGEVNDQDWNRITSVLNMLSERKLFVDETPSLSPNEVRSRARRVAKEHGQLGLIVIDYLQLMQVPGYRSENRTAEISEISRSLKSIAKELNVPVVALSQLNRSLESRADRRPVMSDLRESGAIEQDADLIIFIYRDKVYNENTPDQNVAEIIIAKHRNGEIGKVKLHFAGEYTRFDDLALSDYSRSVVIGGPSAAAPAETSE